MSDTRTTDALEILAYAAGSSWVPLDYLSRRGYDRGYMDGLVYGGLAIKHQFNETWAITRAGREALRPQKGEE